MYIGTTPMNMVRRLLCLIPLLCVVIELGAHALIISNVPAQVDYERAGAELHRRFRPGDAIASAPSFIDPLVRQQVGDLIPLSMVGRHDNQAYRRLWVMGLHGDAPPAELGRQPTPAWQARFGEVMLASYPLPAPREEFELVSRLPQAEVVRVVGSTEQPCTWQRGGPGPGGRLGVGTVPPAGHFRCGQGRDAMVAPVVIEDLDLAPRYCIWHPARKGQHLRIRFEDVTLSDELVVFAGLYYEHERYGEHPAVDFALSIDGERRYKAQHHDGTGFQKWTIPTAAGEHATLQFDAISTRTKHPGFCWYAGVRKAH